VKCKKKNNNDRSFLYLVVVIITSLILIPFASLTSSAGAIPAAEAGEGINMLNLEQPIYMEHYKITNNDKTQILNESFSGNGTMRGLNVVVASSNVTFTPRGNNTVFIEGKGVLTTIRNAGNNSSTNGNSTDRAPYTFFGIGHYQPDGSFRATGAAAFGANASGQLSFLSNAVAVFRDEADIDGNGILRIWQLK